MSTSFWESLLIADQQTSFFIFIRAQDEKGTFFTIFECFYHFRPCERMRKHAFASQNTQHIPKCLSLRNFEDPEFTYPMTLKLVRNFSQQDFLVIKKI